MHNGITARLNTRRAGNRTGQRSGSHIFNRTEREPRANRRPLNRTLSSTRASPRPMPGCGPCGIRLGRPAQAHRRKHTIHTRLLAYNFTCTRYSKTVKTRARKTESPRCSGSTSSAAAPERTLTRTRAHTNTCTIQLYLRRWLYVRSPQRLSPHVEHVLHIVHPCTMVDSQPAMSNTSAHLTYSAFGPKTQCPRRS